VDDVVSGEVQAWHTVADRAGVRLEVITLEEAPALLNTELLRRLLDVLLDNATRYTPAGGTVEVSVSRTEGKAVLEVRDTGIGIPDEERARLFERFFRGRQARERAAEGSGLGLPIAHWIAQQHGARIDIASSPGEGTLVRVEFPPSPGPV
jgi:two-component system sensor histidine kinase CiaH